MADDSDILRLYLQKKALMMNEEDMDASRIDTIRTLAAIPSLGKNTNAFSDPNDARTAHAVAGFLPITGLATNAVEARNHLGNGFERGNIPLGVRADHLGSAASSAIWSLLGGFGGGTALKGAGMLAGGRRIFDATKATQAAAQTAKTSRFGSFANKGALAGMGAAFVPGMEAVSATGLALGTGSAAKAGAGFLTNYTKALKADAAAKGTNRFGAMLKGNLSYGQGQVGEGLKTVAGATVIPGIAGALTGYQQDAENKKKTPPTPSTPH
jgi:hypothetical protein